MKTLLFTILLSLMLFAQSDSIYVRHSARYGMYTYYLLKVADKEDTEILVPDIFIKSIYYTYEKGNYPDYHSYLYDLLIRGKKIDPQIRKQKIHLEFKLKRTQVSIKAKAGIQTVIKEYLKKVNQTYILKKRLTELQQNDLVRIMIKNGFIARRDCLDGHPYFFDRVLLEVFFP